MNAEIDITGVIIETPRLILRPWQMDDLPDFYEYNSDPFIGDMAGWPCHQSMEESRETLELFIREPCVFALELKGSGKAVGSLGIDWLDPNPELNNAQVIILSYDLNRNYWGRGLMPEAINAVIPYCFGTLEAEYLYCSVFDRNRQSQRVAEKCGFRFWKEQLYKSQQRMEASRVYLLPNPNKR